MSQILVFQTPDISHESYVETSDERSILYNNLASTMKNEINGYHFKQFLEMENQILKSAKIITKGVPPILAKELIKYVKPLVIELPESDYLKKDIHFKFKKKIVETKFKITEWFITLQNETSVQSILYPITSYHNRKYEKIKYKNIIVPPGSPFKMIGCVVPDNLGTPMFNNSILLNSIVDDISISNYGTLLETGSYRLDSTSNNKGFDSKVYIQQFDGFEHTKINYDDDELNIKFLESTKPNNKFSNIKRQRIIIFKNSEDALKKMNIILDEIKRIQTYYINNYASILKTIEFNPLQNLDVYKKSLRKKEDLSSYQSSNKTLFDKKLISVVKEIIPEENTRNTKDSIYFALKNKGKLELFNKLKILGTNNAKMQKELNNALMENEVKMIMEYQNKIRTTYILELIKKQAITVNKFGFKAKYSELNSSDTRIVNNEYKKIIEEEIENMKEKKETGEKLILINRRYTIIRNFYKAFNDINPKIALKYTLNDLKEIGIDVTKSNLKYGLCEHNLTKAKLIVDGNKDRKIKDIIINKYAHKHENPINKNHQDKTNETLSRNIKDDITSDYYCNICGERIYINIVEDTIKFVEGKLIITDQEYDSLGDLIYREISYTIRSVLRFKTQLDIRPIIKSLVEVLRPEIGIIESRLSKIRTNIQDDIRDLITLYIDIYIYALISRMIYINHGEITFALRPKFRKFSAVTSKIPEASSKSKKTIEIKKTTKTKNTTLKKNARTKKTKKIKGGYDKFESNEQNDIYSDMSDSEYDESYESDKPSRIMNARKKIKGGNKDKKNRLQNIIYSAYQLLISTKAQLIKKIATIKLEDIQPLLLQAYKWVIGLYMIDTKSEESSYVGLKEEIIDNAINHPIYNYLYKIRNLVSGTEKKDLRTILGKTIETLEKHIQESDIFSNVPMIEENQFVNYIKRTLSSKIDNNEYVELVSKYMYFSYKYLIDYISTNKFKESSVPVSSVLINYYKNLNEVRDMQISLQYINMISKAMPMYIPNFYKYKDRFEYDASFKLLDISKLYRKNGQLHDWNIYVFKKKGGTGKKELTINELNDMIKNGKNIHKDYIISDKKDSVSGEYLSKIKDYSSEINKSMIKLKKTENFFSYFDNRCPISGLHILDNNKKCEKCEIILTSEWKSSKNGQKYYAKYFYIFEKQITAQNLIIKARMNELEKRKIEDSIYKKVEDEKFDKIFQLNEARILNWSRIVKIPFNVLINLGLSEGIKFEKIERGEVNPRKDENMLTYDIKTRTLKLDGYYNNIIYQYYLIKGSTSSYDLPTQINELIDKLPSSKGLQTSMKEIYDPMYHSRFIYFFHVCSNPDDLNKIILNKISETLLQIISSLEKTKFATFGENLVKYFTKEIITKEKLFSKPDPFKYKIDKRSELGDDYASDSSNIESDTADFVSSEEFRSSSEMAETGTDVMNSEQSISGNEYNKFAFDESDILERNEGGD